MMPTLPRNVYVCPTWGIGVGVGGTRVGVAVGADVLVGVAPMLAVGVLTVGLPPFEPFKAS